LREAADQEDQMLRHVLRRRRSNTRNPHPPLYLAEPCEPRRLLAAIASDQTLPGSIASVGQVDAYTFSATAGQTIYAAVAETVAGSPLTVSVELRAPNNAILDAASSATGTAVYVANVTQTGTFTINVTGLNNTTGGYAITLALPGTAPQAGTDAGPITSAAYRTATIGPADLDVHTISGTAGGSLLVTIGELTAGAGFDPEISVYTPTGSLLGSASAAAAGTVILAQNLPTTGTYYVVAADNFNDETGDYGITVATFGGAQADDGDGGPLASADRRTGTITPGDFDVHTIAGTAGGSLLASLGDTDPASGFDPQMIVFSPSGAVLANVAAAVGTNDLEQTLPATGTYFIVTLDQFADETGAYAVTAATFGGAQITDADSGPIASGERRTGTIDVGDFDVYTIAATAAGSLFAAIGETGPTGFDPEVMVFSPTGVLLANVAAATGTNALNQNLAATGTYYVVALDQFGDETGAYGLSVARFGGSQNVSGGDEGGAIPGGDYRTGAILPGDFDVYTIAATTGNTFLAALGDLAGSTGGLDVDLMIFSPTGALLSNTAGAAGTSVIVTDVATTGTYAFVVFDQFSDETGTYGLSVGRYGAGAPAPVVPTGDEGGALASGERRLGHIAPGDMDSFSFTLAAGNGAFWTAGETVDDAFAPRLIILGPSGNAIFNSSTARGRDAALAATGANPAGTYTAIVLDGVGGTPGDYALTGVAVPAVQLTDADSGALVPAAPRAGSLPPGDADVYTVAATAGQALTFNLARTGPAALQPGLIVYAPNGTIAGSNFGTTSTQVVVNSAVAGTYTVVVEESGGDNTGAYSLALNTPAGADTFAPALLESDYFFDRHPANVRLAFSEDVQASFQPDGFTLRNLTTNTAIDPADLAITFHAITNEIYFDFNALPGGVLPDGAYRLSIPAANLTDAAGNPLAAAVALDFFVLAGDANRDRVVNFDDLLILAKNYNKVGATWLQADFTGDGLVNFDDLLVLAKGYNKTAFPLFPAPPLPAATPATTASVLADESRTKPVFSTTPITKRAPAPAKPKPAVKPRYH
jgi:hypothetical protein